MAHALSQVGQPLCALGAQSLSRFVRALGGCARQVQTGQVSVSLGATMGVHAAPVMRSGESDTHVQPSHQR